MDVHELRHRAKENEVKKVRLYNPDTEDFQVQFNDGNGPKIYEIHALEIEEFPFHVANHIKKHLANKLLNKRGIKVNPQADIEKIKQEIEVSIE
jgi:hypothetical protein